MAGARVVIFVLVFLAIGAGVSYILNRPQPLVVPKLVEREIASVDPRSNEDSCVASDAPEMDFENLWVWDPSLIPLPLWKQVVSTPMVGDLGADGKTEIVFNSTLNGEMGVLRVHDGRTGKHKFSVIQGGQFSLATASPVLVDLDGDGYSEIVYLHELKQKIIALNGDGSLRWQFALPEVIQSCRGGLAAAELDGDGQADIIADNFVISESTEKKPFLKFVVGPPKHSSSCTSFAMSLDPAKPRELQIVSGEGAFNKDGQLLWKFPSDLGNIRILAAADVRSDVNGVEVVVVAKGKVSLFDGLSGQAIWTYPIGEMLGAPALASVNGISSLFVLSDSQLIALNGQAEKLWSQLIKPSINGNGGVSLFDMNADSRPEVVFADATRLLVLGPEKGKIFRSTPQNAERGLEYPVVADLNGDEIMDVVLTGGGLRVLKNKMGRAIGRNVWNQYSYFVTNVTDSLKPTTATPTTGVFAHQFRSNRMNSQNVACASSHQETPVEVANKARRK